RLAIFSKNNLDFVIITFALARIGAVLIPVNYMLRGKDIAYILEHAGAKGIFTEKEHITTIEEATPHLSLTYKFIIECEKQVEQSDWTRLVDVQQAGSDNPIVATLYD